MCRSTGEGYRRCKSGIHGKVIESYQKALYYRAKKTGKTISQWITDNPEENQKLQDKRDSKLKIATQDSPTSNSKVEKAVSSSVEFLKPDVMRTIDPRAASMVSCIKESKKELGELTPSQQHALLGYTGISYQSVNKALLGVDGFQVDEWEKEGWRDRNKVGSTFRDYHDAADYVNELDSFLKERNSEERITYRGIVGSGISRMLNSISGTEHYNTNGSLGHIFTDDEKSHATQKLVEHYKQGTQIKFDSYVSTSLNPSTGANWAYSDKNSVGIIYEIKTNAGKNISSASNIDTEREVLLPRGLNFKVVNAYIPKDYKYQNANRVGDITEKSTKGRNGYVVVQLVEVDDLGNEIGSSVKEHIPSKKIDGHTLEMEEFDRIEKMLEEEDMDGDMEDMDSIDEDDDSNW